ncbi:MAG TPA: M28 family peptidase [Thermoanaerobaculia bacterium]|nr:M28 family peptidase [Thermoanaerobaculia bacterium]
MTRRSSAAAAIVLAALAACSGRDPLAQRATRLETLVDPARMKGNVEILARVPHRAGSSAQRAAVEAAAGFLRAAGLEAVISEHTAAIPEPVEVSLAVEGPAGHTFDLVERELAGDPYSGAAPAEVPFFAWAPDGDVSGRVVYANHGAREDYEVLRRADVPVKGAIVLARAQGICRSMKSLLAEEAGAAALLLYPERRDLGIVKPDFPAGPYLNPWTVQRGSMLRYFLHPGDPDCAAGRALPRLRPALPALPVSESVAKELLGRVEGAPAPEAWTGWLDVPYRLGTTRESVRLRTRSRTEVRVLRNVTAVLAGRRRDAGVVVVGAHTDAWVNGAVDPVSGVAAVLEVAWALSALARGGWRGERDIVFTLFDGEEYGMLGSTLWVEERLTAHAPPMAAFLYVDSSVRALDFMADVSPGMRKSLDEVLGHVADPVSGRVLLSLRGVPQLPGFSGDTSPFLGLGGVPSVQIGFGRRTYPQYHSAYDDPYLLGRILDPGYRVSATVARILALLASELAGSPEPPWRLSEVASFLDDELSKLAKGPASAQLVRRSELFSAVLRLRLAARGWESLLPAHRRSVAEKAEPLLLDAMAAFHDGAAPEFQRRNLLLGPSAESGCGTDTLPGLRRALHGDGSVEAETARLLRALATSASKLHEAARIAIAR